MKLVQKEPNSVWYTEEILKCSKCWKKESTVYDIKNNWLFCHNCFYKNFKSLFWDDEYITVKLITNNS